MRRVHRFLRGRAEDPEHVLGRSLRVFLVDPDPERRGELAASIRRGADVELLGTGSGAAITAVLLNTLVAKAPDVVLVAWDSPVESGSTTAGVVLARYPQARVWAYAADPTPAAAEAARSGGAAGLLAERALFAGFRSALHTG